MTAHPEPDMHAEVTVIISPRDRYSGLGE